MSICYYLVMHMKDWVSDNIIYRFCGCSYANTQEELFDTLEDLIPKEFLNRDISDLGCGDGTNSLRIKKIFKAKSIKGYERNPHLVSMAKENDLDVVTCDLTKEVPNGDLAIFSLSLHHIPNSEKAKILKQVAQNFNYVFLLEPVLDLWHFLFDFGYALSHKDWIKLFDESFSEYELLEHQKFLVVFSKKS